MKDLPPTPWTVTERTGLSFLLDIIDANGDRVVTVWGHTPERRQAVADLIIDKSKMAARDRWIGGS
jgi:hypothetical protein